MTKLWLEQQNITNMVWPAKSSDLNPIENLWGILSREVYANGRQYSSLTELKSVIEEKWYNLDPEIIQNLITSMPNRVFKVINSNGTIIG